MPTVIINTPPMSTTRRREISVRLTRWLTVRGSERHHVIVRFEDTVPDSVFVGGMPLEALPGAADSLHYASVLCCVAEEHGEDFRDDLANEIADCLGMTEQTPLLYIEFRPTPRENVRFATRGHMSSAAASAEQ
ncbi:MULTISPECIES: hypothetical protein [unclassified Actinopolyspora]|uniref:hypothetical protein n=1 Tax=unclassified Actinopolyspora TaxID=2639451 RepID=UPI0013F67181|nr:MULTISPECIES: hypothetical protein [unclassified Actinopolyspora]NHD19424.1 hypothetical protein [Actinopolyspora sp. BKK2]NHE78503.1 hypothetical protein [Actinopolyspora sp. BKK1]